MVYYGEGYRAKFDKGWSPEETKCKHPRVSPSGVTQDTTFSRNKLWQPRRNVISQENLTESRSPVSVAQTYSACVTNRTAGAPDPKKVTVSAKYLHKLVQCDSKPWACKDSYQLKHSKSSIREAAQGPSWNRLFWGLCKIWAIWACSVNTSWTGSHILSSDKDPNTITSAPPRCRWVWEE